MASDPERTVGVLADIYEAIGDAERWRRLNERIAVEPLPAELQPHFEVARGAHGRQLALEHDIAMLTTVHDRNLLGVLAVDAGGRVLAANAMAQRMLAEADGVLLMGGRLHAAEASERATLRRTIERQAAGVSESTEAESPVVLVSRAGRPPLCLVVLPVEGRLRFFEDRGTVLVFVLDHGHVPVTSERTFRELFGLTAREGELAVLLAQGKSVSEAAEALGVSVNTARTLLSRLTAKTDSHSQAELVRQLLAIPH